MLRRWWGVVSLGKTGGRGGLVSYEIGGGGGGGDGCYG